MKLKTIKTVQSEHPEYKGLINAVVRNLHHENISDVNSHGIQGGYGNFVYYSDTVKFAYRWRKQILSLLDEDVDSFGEKDLVGMISNFGYFRNNKMDKDDRKDLYRYLGGSKCTDAQMPNLMAWYAAETVARYFEE